MDEHNYDAWVREIRRLPVTWYPALIREMVLAACAKKIFKPGGASHMVRNVEEELPRGKSDD